jgi:hypothetical protein
MSDDDLLERPLTAYANLDDGRYKAEQDLAQKYREFVTEILRLSLGGIAVFPFIYKDLVKDLGPQLRLTVTSLAATGVVSFAFSAAFALWFLYLASEGLRWYIVGLRYLHMKPGKLRQDPDLDDACANKSARDMLEKRLRVIGTSRFSKIAAAILLGLGAVLMAVAIFLATLAPSVKEVFPKGWASVFG